MDHPIAADSASRFEAYVEGLVSVIGHADRARPLRDYCVGLMMELSPEVGDVGNREGGISWGCLTPPLLHRRSDMPCPKITSSS